MKKQALITGATSGIGRATALRLAAEGYDITATGRRAERLETLRREIEAAGGRCTALVFDVRSEAEVRKFLSPLERVDLLINNAGCGYLVRCKTCGAESRYLRRGAVVRSIAQGRQDCRCRRCGGRTFTLERMRADGL